MYSENSGFIGSIDPITKSPFVKGEDVVLCREKNSLISLRSLKSNNYECPLCNRRLNSDLIIEGPTVIGSGQKGKKAWTGTNQSQPQPNPIIWISILVVLAFCFILTVSGVFASVLSAGGNSNPAPSNTRIISTSTPIPPKPRPTNTSRPINTSRPQTNASPTVVINNYALISCAQIHKVNLRKTPGYVGKDDKKDSLYEVPCGEFVELLGPSQKVDGLTWWKVYWNGYTGWIADHTGSGKIILDFNP